MSVCDAGADSRLTLLSAPAGFGKTTLLAEWLGESPGDERCVAWLSLDASDSEPASFWTYVVTALHTAVPGVGVSALDLVASSPVPTERVLTTLVNELAAAPCEVWLVLDDYHLVDGHEVRDGMTFLLEHLPPQVHVVLSTRADPRPATGAAGGRAASWSRSAPPTCASRPRRQPRTSTRRRGWASPQRTSRSWRNAPRGGSPRCSSPRCRSRDATTSPASSPGSPGTTGTSSTTWSRRCWRINLTRFASSCSTRRCSTGSPGRCATRSPAATTASQMLMALDRANLFIAPLDDRREWYRYHPLFADVLRARLLSERPDQVPLLHQRASAWYEAPRPVGGGNRARPGGAGLRSRDLPHRDGRAGDPTQPARGDAPRLAEGPARRRRPAQPGAQRPLRLHAHGHPATSTRSRPDSTTPTGRWPPCRTASAPPWADTEDLRTLPSTIAIHRASLAQARGDTAGTAEHARRALALAGPDDHLARGGAAGFLGLAAWAQGDVAGALETFTAGRGQPARGRQPRRRAEQHRGAGGHVARGGSPEQGSPALPARPAGQRGTRRAGPARNPRPARGTQRDGLRGRGPRVRQAAPRAGRSPR